MQLQYLHHIKAFKDRLPPVTSYRMSGKQRKNVRSGPNYWAYGTSYLVTLLFNGQLPKSFLKQLCDNPEVPEKEKKHLNTYRGPVVQSKQREVALWEPKNYKRIQESGRRIEPKILEARWRQRDRLDSISLRLSSKKPKGEEVLLKKEETMGRGKKAYLNKVERENKHKQPAIKRPQTPTDEPIFELTEVSDN